MDGWFIYVYFMVYMFGSPIKWLLYIYIYIYVIYNGKTNLNMDILLHKTGRLPKKWAPLSETRQL